MRKNAVVAIGCGGESALYSNSIESLWLSSDFVIMLCRCICCTSTKQWSVSKSVTSTMLRSRSWRVCWRTETGRMEWPNDLQQR